MQLEVDHCCLAIAQASKLVQITASITNTNKVIPKKLDENKEESTIAAINVAMAVDMAKKYGGVVSH